jgi:hypothetical protein
MTPGREKCAGSGEPWAAGQYGEAVCPVCGQTAAAIHGLPIGHVPWCWPPTKEEG